MRSLIFRFRLEIWQIWGHFTCAGITFKRSVSLFLISTSSNKVNELLTKIDDYIKKSVICAHSCFISLKTLFCVASPWTDHKTFKIKITMFMLERRNIERRSWIFVSHSLMKVCRISRDLTCLKRSVSPQYSVMQLSSVIFLSWNFRHLKLAVKKYPKSCQHFPLILNLRSDQMFIMTDLYDW